MKPLAKRPVCHNTKRHRDGCAYGALECRLAEAEALIRRAADRLYPGDNMEAELRAFLTAAPAASEEKSCETCGRKPECGHYTATDCGHYRLWRPRR